MAGKPGLLDVITDSTYHVAGFLLGAIVHRSIEMGVPEMVLVAFLCGKILDLLP